MSKEIFFEALKTAEMPSLYPNNQSLETVLTLYGITPPIIDLLIS